MNQEEVRILTEKTKSQQSQAYQLIQKMQEDCHLFTTTLKDAQRILSVDFTDEQLDIWLGDGLFIFLGSLFEKATGQRPNEVKIGRGVYQQEPLTKHHLEMLEREHGLDLELYESTVEGLLHLHHTSYFETKILRGKVVIDECEFNGNGITGIVAFKAFATPPF